MQGLTGVLCSKTSQHTFISPFVGCDLHRGVPTLSTPGMWQAVISVHGAASGKKPMDIFVLLIWVIFLSIYIRSFNRK